MNPCTLTIILTHTVHLTQYPISISPENVRRPHGVWKWQAQFIAVISNVQIVHCEAGTHRVLVHSPINWYFLKL